MWGLIGWRNLDVLKIIQSNQPFRTEQITGPFLNNDLRPSRNTNVHISCMDSLMSYRYRESKKGQESKGDVMKDWCLIVGNENKRLSIKNR